MGNDVTWWKQPDGNRQANDTDSARELPGDTDAPDIVGRTGEEMPEATHDEVGTSVPQPADEEQG